VGVKNGVVVLNDESELSFVTIARLASCGFGAGAQAARNKAIASRKNKVVGERNVSRASISSLTRI